MPTPTRLRSEVALLTREAEADLAALWRQVESAVAAETVLRDVLPGLVSTYGAAAATVAADWYDDTRQEREFRRGFGAIAADLGDAGMQALIGWALTVATDLPAFQSLIEGGTQRRIANYARQTVMQSSVADPQAQGWKRVGSGGSCDFCLLLLSRGAVYRESTADFNAHDRDDCYAAPAWR